MLWWMMMKNYASKEYNERDDDYENEKVTCESSWP